MWNPCNPSKVYLAIAVISLFYYAIIGIAPIILIIHFLFIFLWAYFLDKLCKWGYEFVSWILILLPLISTVAFAIRQGIQLVPTPTAMITTMPIIRR